MEQRVKSFDILDAIVAGLLQINKKAVIGITSDNLFAQNLFNTYLESHLDSQVVLSVKINDGCVTKFYDDNHNEDTFVFFCSFFPTNTEKGDMNIGYVYYYLNANTPFLFNSDENIRDVLVDCYNKYFYSASEELTNQEDNSNQWDYHSSAETI